MSVRNQFFRVNTVGFGYIIGDKNELICIAIKDQDNAMGNL